MAKLHEGIWQTGTQFGSTERSTLLEPLKVNTTLTELNMESVEEGGRNNLIGDDGSAPMSEMMEVNTARVSLSMSHKGGRRIKEGNNHLEKVTDKRVKGAQMMSEVMKENTTLISLDMSGEKELEEDEERKE